MQNDNSNIQEFCGGMKRSWCESAEGIIALVCHDFLSTFALLVPIL